MTRLVKIQMNRGAEMKIVCEWCDGNAKEAKDDVYWELPDGTRAIEISDTPAVSCGDCNMLYYTDEITREIENQLFIVDTNTISKSISYEELMGLPKLLKRNYFDFLL